jgi:nucleoside-diphosphate-sugar epimerase
MHVVVTGAGGFVGGFLARWLADQGERVTAITRRAPPSEPPRNGLTWREADLRAPDALPDQFDALIHCAAETPARCPDPAVLYDTNMQAARNVFERALSAKARAVVFMSSMSVYGTISVPVVTEETVPQSPDSYGRSKKDAEDLLKACVARGLPSGLAIRLPGTVGKGSHDNFLSGALARVLAGDTVQISNPDALFNNIVYVGHLAQFLSRWIVHPRAGYAVTNLAAAEPMPVRDLIGLLFKCANKPLQVRESDGGKPPFLILLDRAMSLGYAPPAVRDSVQAFVRDAMA